MINFWATSDWHFQHKKMLTVWNDRPRNYETLIIDRYAELVQQGDITYFLGDMLFSPNRTGAWFSHIMQDLPGTKFLVRGNHDQPKRTPDKYWTEECGFIAVFPYYTIRQDLLFSHIPIRLPTGRKDTRYFYESMLLHDVFKEYQLRLNLHGHTHKYSSDHPSAINVGVDAWDFKPMNINHLVDG